MSNEWNPTIRETWNPVIEKCQNAIDNHVKMSLETGDSWHVIQAGTLRNYLKDLKEWIHKQEGCWDE